MTTLSDLITQGVNTVRLSYPDLHGIARGKEFPASYFEQLVEDGAAHCEAIMTVDLRHNVVAGPGARVPGHRRAARPGHARPHPLGPDGGVVPGRPGADGRDALRRRLARGAAARRGGVRGARPGPDAGHGPGARVLSGGARRERAERLPQVRRQRQPRVHRGQRGRSAGRAARDAPRVRRPGAGRVRRQPRVRPLPVRDQPPPLPRAGRGRPRLPVQGRGQGDVGPPWPAGHVHRQAVERRRGLRLPPAPVARRRARQQRAGRPRQGRAVPGGDALHRRPARRTPRP